MRMTLRATLTASLAALKATLGVILAATPHPEKYTQRSPGKLNTLPALALLFFLAPGTASQAAPGTTSQAAPGTASQAAPAESTITLSSSTPAKLKYRTTKTALVKEARVLDFPPDKAVGSVLVQFDKDEKGKSSHKLFKAMGRVSIPPGTVVVFMPNERFFANPKVLDGLKPDAIDGLRMKFFPMDEAEEGRGDAGLAYLSRFSNLRYVDLDRSEVSDRGLKTLKNLKHLEVIAAFGTSIDGSAFKEMGRMESVKSLNLPNTNPKMEELKNIPAVFPNLVSLNLGRTRLTNAVMPAIGRLSRLERLDISNNLFLTDDAMEHILKLKQLRLLELGDTSISARGLAKLKGTRIENLIVTARQFKPGEMEQLQKVLKTVQFTVLNKRLNRDIDPETKAIFGPMSRGRGL